MTYNNVSETKNYEIMKLFFYSREVNVVCKVLLLQIEHYGYKVNELKKC